MGAARSSCFIAEAEGGIITKQIISSLFLRRQNRVVKCIEKKPQATQTVPGKLIWENIWPHCILITEFNFSL